MDILEKIKNMVDELVLFADKKENGKTRYTLSSYTSKQKCISVLIEIKNMLKNYKFYDFNAQNGENISKYSVDLSSLNKRISFNLEKKNYSFEEVNQLLNSVFYSIDKFLEENKRG